MYSPKINEELIPRLYRRAKKEGVSMTKLVDQIVRDSFNRKEKSNEENVELDAKAAR